MGQRNGEQKIWLITDFSGLVHEDKDTRIKTEGTMEIQSLDVIKQYIGVNRKLMIAVKVTNKKSKPIALAEVGLFIVPPNDNSLSLYRYTDSEGVAVFEISDPNSGKLYAGVTSIRHPFHVSDKDKLHDKWLTVRV
jgi:hypothetical protein